MRNIIPVRSIFAVNVRGYVTDEGVVTRRVTKTEINNVNKDDFFDIIENAPQKDVKMLMEDRHVYTGDKVIITVVPKDERQ